MRRSSPGIERLVLNPALVAYRARLTERRTRPRAVGLTMWPFPKPPPVEERASYTDAAIKVLIEGAGGSSPADYQGDSRRASRRVPCRALA